MHLFTFAHSVAAPVPVCRSPSFFFFAILFCEWIYDAIFIENYRLIELRAEYVSMDAHRWLVARRTAHEKCISMLNGGIQTFWLNKCISNRIKLHWIDAPPLHFAPRPRSLHTKKNRNNLADCRHHFDAVKLIPNQNVWWMDYFSTAHQPRAEKAKKKKLPKVKTKYIRFFNVRWMRTYFLH